MQARMDNPAVAVPGALEALQSLSKAIHRTGLPDTTSELVHLRASQINGCGVCLQMHAQALRKAGESDEKIDTVAGWRDAPYFDAAERAALALTEAVTRLSDRSDPVPDDVYAEAAAQFDEQQLGGLILTIAAINVWNRVNVTTHQVAGAWG
ncbi:carboxymuconolactone decarboxylase family protein [Aeromicrobium sp. NPDC092404]|uniref:carboxymuconolactone decarboxylase family protein n=1 Tax=Aeromicrobium sp. NPDC092404 TaxID=3154976 RepID=UPI003413BD88